MLASESVALDILGYNRIDDVAPGEAIFISNRKYFVINVLPTRNSRPVFSNMSILHGLILLLMTYLCIKVAANGRAREGFSASFPNTITILMR